MKKPATPDPIACIKARYLTSFAASQPACSWKQDEAVADLMRRQILDARHTQYGGWGDVTDAASPALAWDGASLPQLRALAEAWNAPLSRFYRSRELAERISLAATFYASVMTPPEPFPNNWWHWQIGLPSQLCRIFLSAGQTMDPSAHAALLNAYRYLVDRIWDFHAAANLMSVALSLLGYGVVAGDPVCIARASQWAEQSAAPVSDPLREPQGFRGDGTYFYHGSRVNMAYGAGHLFDFALAAHLMAGTGWAVGGDGLERVVNVLLDFVEWTCFAGGIDPFILDRDIAAPPGPNGAAEITRRLLDAGLLLIKADASRQEELHAFCGRLVADGVAPTLAITQSVADTHCRVIPPEPCGVRHFSEAEYAAARRPAWAASVKMATWRTCAYAGINRLNRKGWHISDGHLILRTHGGEFEASVLPTLDWERLSGITRADGFRLPHETMGHSWFSAGAVSDDGIIGCCGLDFAIRRPDDQCELAARKNWFFLEDAIVATGSNIWTTAPVSAETVIRHVVLPPAFEQTEFVEGDLAVEFLTGHDCVYILPEKPRIRVYTEWREGHYGEIGEARHADKRHRRRYWTAVIPHAAGPHPCWGHPASDGRYVVVYLPAMTLQAAQAWWASQPFDILQQDVLAHRLHDRRNGRVLAVTQWKGAAVERPGAPVSA